MGGGLLDKNFLGLYGGVSQQPASLRDASQLELQENAWSSLVDGLQTRPPTEFIASLHNDIDEDSMFHYIDRDSGEKYIVIFTGDETTPIRVYDMDGLEKTVNYGVLNEDGGYYEDTSVKDYLTCDTPKSDLRAYTIADATVITNKGVVTQATKADTATTPPQALISVESIVQSQNLSIFVNDSKEADVATSPSSTTESIAQDIYNDLLSNLGSLSNQIKITTEVSPDIEPQFGWGQNPSGGIFIDMIIDGVTIESGVVIATVGGPVAGESSFDSGSSLAVHSLNREATCAKMAAALQAELSPSVWVVEHEGVSVGVRRQDGATFTYSLNLYHNLEAVITAPDVTGDGWIITRDEDSSVVYVKRADDADFNIHGHDTWGNHAMTVIKDVTQDFSNLPSTAPDDFLVKVGKPTNDGTFGAGYYLRYEVGTNEHDGVWRETRKEAISHGFDETTMPHYLVRLADGTFVFAPIVWIERNVGDNETLPYPSFIGQPVNNIFLHANRLCFLSGENMIASRTNAFFNFWPETALDVLDTDPIDVALSDETISPLQHARAFDRHLLLFSKERQYVLSAGELVFSPNTVTADLVTSYKVTDDTTPISVGSSVFFATPSGNYSRIHEYFVQPDSVVNDAEDTTAHVPSYIPKNVIKLTGSTSFDMVLAQSADEPKSVYSYVYRWQGNNKVQSSWSKWTFDDDILFIEIQGSFLYMATRRGSEVAMEKLELELTNTSGLSYKVRLDKQTELTGEYDVPTEKTTWTLPYSDDPSTDIRAIAASTGQRVTLSEHPTPTTVVAEGDHSGELHIIGRHYTPKFTLSEWFIKPEGSNATIAGKLKMRSLKLAYTDTGAFKVKVTPRGRDTLVHTHSGVKLGVTQFGPPTTSTDEDTFALMCGSIGADVTIEGHTHLPFKFHAAQLRGMYVTHGKAI